MSNVFSISFLYSMGIEEMQIGKKICVRHFDSKRKAEYENRCLFGMVKVNIQPDLPESLQCVWPTIDESRKAQAKMNSTWYIITKKRYINC